MKAWHRKLLGWASHGFAAFSILALLGLVGTLSHAAWMDRGPVPLSSIVGRLGCCGASLLAAGCWLACIVAFMPLLWRDSSRPASMKMLWGLAFLFLPMLAFPAFYWGSVHARTDSSESGGAP